MLRENRYSWLSNSSVGKRWKLSLAFFIFTHNRRLIRAFAWYKLAAQSDFPYQKDGSVELDETWVVTACVLVVFALMILFQRYVLWIVAKVAATVLALLTVLIFSGYGHTLKLRIYTSNRRTQILVKKFGDKSISAAFSKLECQRARWKKSWGAQDGVFVITNGMENLL